MVDVIIEPLSYGTTWRALLEMTILGLVGGVLGCWVVLFRLSYGAESLAHGMLPGLVLAGLAGVPLLLGGAVGIVAAGTLVALSTRIRFFDSDTAVAVVVTTLFGAGVLLALSPSSPSGVGELLFGNLLGTTDSEILVSGASALLILSAVWVLHPRLLAVGFDGDAAGFARIPAPTVSLILLVLVSITILIAVQALGTLLVAALLVGPGATARLVTRRVVPMIGCSVALAALAGLAGILASFYLKTAAGASVVAFILLFFLGAAAYETLRARMPTPVRG